MNKWGTITQVTDPISIGEMSNDQLADWLNARCGRLTASRMDEAIGRTKSGAYTAQRWNLMRELLAERLTGNAMNHFVSAEMRWGLEQEPYAKQAYEIHTGNIITPCGFFIHPDIDDWGATPDGIFKEEAKKVGVEIKCPKTETFIEWMLAGVVPDQHKEQMAAQIICAGLDEVEFIAFDPRIKRLSAPLFIRRFKISDHWRSETIKEAKLFLTELEACWQALIHSPLEIDGEPGDPQ